MSKVKQYLLNIIILLKANSKVNSIHFIREHKKRRVDIVDNDCQLKS